MLSQITKPRPPRGRGVAGPSNIRSLGAEAAKENLSRAVETAFKDAKLERFRLASACLALAGSGRDDEREAIRKWAVQVQLVRSQATRDRDRGPSQVMLHVEGLEFR